MNDFINLAITVTTNGKHLGKDSVTKFVRLAAQIEDDNYAYYEDHEVDIEIVSKFRQKIEECMRALGWE